MMAGNLSIEQRKWILKQYWKTENADRVRTAAWVQAFNTVYCKPTFGPPCIRAQASYASYFYVQTSFLCSVQNQTDELITRPKESYRLWCDVVCDLEKTNLVNEEAKTH